MNIQMQANIPSTSAFNRHTAQNTAKKAQEHDIARLVRPRRARRSVDIAGERAAWQEREARLREAEHERINRINEEIATVLKSGLCDDYIEMAVEMLKRDITQIHEDRATRAQLWAEREMMLLQQLQEERVREREEAAAQRTRQFECADTLEINENTRSLMLKSARMDNISSLKSTRARLASEENLLAQAVDNAETPVQIGLNHTVTARSGHMNEDYRNTQLRELRTGMARIDITIRGEVARMYRDSQANQTAYLANDAKEGNIVLPDEADGGENTPSN